MAKVISLVERKVVEGCADWHDKMLNTLNPDDEVERIKLNSRYTLELEAKRYSEHTYEVIDGEYEIVEPQYDSWGKVAVFGIYIIDTIRDITVDGVTIDCFASREEFAEDVRYLYGMYWDKED